MNRHLTHILSALALSLATATVWADNNRGADNNASANNTTTYYINAPRFVRPILSQWISDYERVMAVSVLPLPKRQRPVRTARSTSLLLKASPLREATRLLLHATPSFPP